MTNAFTADRQPHPNLLIYYVLASLAAGPLFPVFLVVRIFRYRTLRYRFDDEGVSMRWGVLFRREISLTYARLQDIHLTSNAVERWLGLAKLQLQTASGSAAAEMTIEGLQDFEALRDRLYERMRVAHPEKKGGAATSNTVDAGSLAEVAAALREATAELHTLRVTIESAGGAGDRGGNANVPG